MRLVDADDIPYAVNIDHSSGEYDYAYRCEIDALPTVDAVPVVHGKWIPWKYHDGFRCEKCNEPVYNKHNYCPNCGADMRGEQDD